MKRLICGVKKLMREDRGQDMIEYALMAGFVAVAAGAFLPNVSKSISTIFSNIQSILSASAAS